jgi:hypothetical protein
MPQRIDMQMILPAARSEVHHEVITAAAAAGMFLN